MIYTVEILPEAGEQLRDLEDYIASAATPAIASGFVTEIVDACSRLDTFPNRGTPRDDVRKGIRTIPFRRRTTIAYVVEDARVVILGIYYGGQDWESRLSD